MKCRRDTPLFLSSMTPPLRERHDIPSGHDTCNRAAYIRGLSFQAPAAPAGSVEKPVRRQDHGRLAHLQVRKAPKQCEPARHDRCWDIKDGELWKDGNANDMITKEQFGDFELELEWKIGKAGNSGIFYRGTEDAKRHLLERAGIPAARQHRRRRQQDATTTSPARCTTSMSCRKDAVKPVGRVEPDADRREGESRRALAERREGGAIRRRQPRLGRQVPAPASSPSTRISARRRRGTSASRATTPASCHSAISASGSFDSRLRSET